VELAGLEPATSWVRSKFRFFLGLREQSRNLSIAALFVRAPSFCRPSFMADRACSVANEGSRSYAA
jgi:hypothetical protein